MTHDELLGNLNSLNFWNSRTLETAYLTLRAVAEVHKPEPRLDETLIRKEVLVCGHCWSNKTTWAAAYRYVYPCPTIQAIEGQLK